MTGETGVEVYLRFVLTESLARWAEAGTDRRGGFIERIGQDGTPDRAAPRRLRVQARQIYVFAEASRLGLIEARGLASDGFAAMAERYWSADGGFIFSCDHEGRAHDPARYAYEQAFVLLAAAALHRVGGNRLVLDWADRTQRFLDERLADPRGGGYFDAPGQDAPRGQNPHMHLFEAYLALFEATGDRAWRRRAEAMLALFTAHFLDARGAVGEFFTARWQPAPGG
ncbi:MAG: AGE family epimerase/isomerase, partial [Acetobacteraceae bacterium]